MEDRYVHQPMLTCIGNKRKLVGNIRAVVEEVGRLEGKEKMAIADGFAGSTVVARELSYVSSELYVNDLELYSYLLACSLVCPTPEQQKEVAQHLAEMNRLAENGPYVEGVICALYAPKDTADIKEGERCYYTRENALIIDTLRLYLDNVPAEIRTYCMVPLLVKASINTNTGGVFKGFYKNGDVGCWGGKGGNALSRILKPIRVEMPIWHNCPVHPANLDIMDFIRSLPPIDFLYLDPPYNQHPYGSNYFMLNVIANNKFPTEMSKVSGIPTDWNKSVYNSKKEAADAMKRMIALGLTKAKYLLISYNNEGIIRDWTTMLAPYNVKKYQVDYDTYKGCRNLKKRNNKVIEIMYLVTSKSDAGPELTPPNNA